MDKAARAATKQGQTMSQQAAKIGKAFIAMGVAAASGLAYFTKQAIDTQDAIRDLSQRTGASTEFLSEIAYTAQQSGTSLEKVATSLTKLARTAVESVQNITGPAALAFDKLGVSAKNADGTLKESEELFVEIAQALSGYEDGLGKAAITQAIFGKGSAELTELLNLGAAGIEESRKRAEAWGNTVSTASAEAADAFKDNLFDIQEANRGLINQLTTAMLPALADFSDIFVDDLAEAFTQNKGDIIIWGEAITHVLAIVLDAFHAASATLSTGFKLLGEGIAANAAALVQRVQGNSQAADAILIDFAGRAAALVEGLANDPEMGKYQQAWEDLRLGITGAGDALEEIDLSKLPKRRLTFIDEGAAATARQAQATALAQLQQMEAALVQQVATYEKGETAVLQYSIAHGELAKTLATAGAAATSIGDRLVAYTAALEVMRIKSEAVAKAEAARLKLQEDIQAVIEANLTPEEALMAERKRLADLLGSGLPVADYEKAIAAAELAYKKSFDGLTIFTDEASRNIQDIIADGLVNGFDEGMDGILKMFTKMIQEMLAQAIAADIAEALFGPQGGAPGAGSSARPGTSSVTCSVPRGGPVQAGRSYIVGERGPEVFTAGTSGGITPLATPGGVAITQNNYISGSNLGPEQMTRILEENNKKLKGEFLQELRRGAYA